MWWGFSHKNLDASHLSILTCSHVTQSLLDFRLCAGKRRTRSFACNRDLFKVVRHFVYVVCNEDRSHFSGVFCVLWWGTNYSVNFLYLQNASLSNV